MEKDQPIFVAGHRGLVGSAICRELERQGYTNLLRADRKSVDLRNRADVDKWFASNRPEWVFLAAAKVGGILANSAYPAEFIFDNLTIQSNVIDSAYRHGTRKLQFLGSSCIYPKLAPQPLKAEYLLSGPLEPTNEWYAVAKLAGWKLAEAYTRQYGFPTITLIPTNLYGPGDNFHPQDSHVIPGLMRRFHESKLKGDPAVTIWGSGSARREFLHVDDLASAAVFLMEKYSGHDPINVGVGNDIPIRELSELLRSVTGFRGALEFDTSKPDGTPRKLLDITPLSQLGWRPRIGLEDGLRQTYDWFVANAASLR